VYVIIRLVCSIHDFLGLDLCQLIHLFYVRRDIYLKYGSYSLSYKIAADYDLMVRLFYKARIKYKYIKKDFVTMRVGGLSTRNVRSRLLITKEDVLACRRNGMYTNILFISCKYIVKIFEFKL
jgi:hypothetical protein